MKLLLWLQVNTEQELPLFKFITDVLLSVTSHYLFDNDRSDDMKI